MGKALIAAVILALVLAGAFFAYQYSLAQKLSYSVGTVTASNATQEGITLNIPITINNPTDLPLTVYALNGNITVNGKPASVTSIPQPIVIEAKGTTIVNIVVLVNVTSIVDSNNINSFLNSPVIFNGSLDFSILGFRIPAYPLNYQTTVSKYI